MPAGGQGGWGLRAAPKGPGDCDGPQEGGSLDKCLSPPSAQRETASPYGGGQGRAGIARWAAGAWLARAAGLKGPQRRPQRASDPLHTLRAASLDRGHLPPQNSSPDLPPPRPLEFRRLQGTPGWLESTPGSPQASSFPDVDLGLHSRPALPKKHLGCRRGVASWRSPGCHLPGHLRLRLGVTQALLAWERRQSSADRTERPLPRLSGRQTRCWGLPLLGAQRQRHQGRPARPR